MSEPTMREKAKVLMDEALASPEGISAEFPPEQITSMRSLCYAVRETDRIFNDGKSKYSVLTFSIEFPGPKLFVRRKPGGVPRSQGTQNSNADPAGAKSVLLRRGT